MNYHQEQAYRNKKGSLVRFKMKNKVYLNNVLTYSKAQYETSLSCNVAEQVQPTFNLNQKWNVTHHIQF